MSRPFEQIKAGLEEALAWSRGEVELETVSYDKPSVSQAAIQRDIEERRERIARKMQP